MTDHGKPWRWLTGEGNSCHLAGCPRLRLATAPRNEVAVSASRARQDVLVKPSQDAAPVMTLNSILFVRMYTLHSIPTSFAFLP